MADEPKAEHVGPHDARTVTVFPQVPVYLSMGSRPYALHLHVQELELGISCDWRVDERGVLHIVVRPYRSLEGVRD